MAAYPKLQGSVDKMSNNPIKFFINNHLHNGPKPLKVGDHAHLTTWEGMYKVYGVDAMFFVVMKNRVFYRIPWEHLKCKAGNHGTSERSRLRATIEASINELKGMLPLLKR